MAHAPAPSYQRLRKARVTARLAVASRGAAGSAVRINSLRAGAAAACSVIEAACAGAWPHAIDLGAWWRDGMHMALLGDCHDSVRTLLACDGAALRAYCVAPELSLLCMDALRAVVAHEPDAPDRLFAALERAVRRDADDHAAVLAAEIQCLFAIVHRQPAAFAAALATGQRRARADQQLGLAAIARLARDRGVM